MIKIGKKIDDFALDVYKSGCLYSGKKKNLSRQALAALLLSRFIESDSDYGQ